MNQRFVMLHKRFPSPQHDRSSQDDPLRTVFMIVSVLSSVTPKSPSGSGLRRISLSESLLMLSAEAGERFLLSRSWKRTLEVLLEQLGGLAGANHVAIAQFVSLDGRWQMDEEDTLASSYWDLLLPLAPAWGPPELFPDTILFDFEARKVASAVILPIVAGGRLWGMCRMEFLVPRLDYTLEDISAMMRLTRVVGAAVWRNAAEDRLKEDRERLEQRLVKGTQALAQQSLSLDAEIRRRERLESEVRTGALQLIESCSAARDLFRQAVGIIGGEGLNGGKGMADSVPFFRFSPDPDGIRASLPAFGDGDHQQLESAIMGISQLFDEISALCKEHRQVRDLLVEVWRGQESERETIAKHLHEHLAQDLSTSRILCEMLKTGIPDSRSDLKGGLHQISDVLQKSVAALRNLAYKLHPPDIEELGLRQSIETLCSDVSRQGGIRISFQAAGFSRVRLDGDVSIQIYRVLEELLEKAIENNAFSEVRFRAVASSPFLIFRMQGDFSKEKATCRPQIRVPNAASERISLLGGRIQMTDTKEGELRILIEIPLPAECFRNVMVS